MTADYALALIKEPTCPHCGQVKAIWDSFCNDCYYSLPAAMCVCLCRQIGNGYEEAYDEAITWLTNQKSS